MSRKPAIGSQMSFFMGRDTSMGLDALHRVERG
jgi:hypothetical protein